MSLALHPAPPRLVCSLGEFGRNEFPMNELTVEKALASVAIGNVLRVTYTSKGGSAIYEDRLKVKERNSDGRYRVVFEEDYSRYIDWFGEPHGYQFRRGGTSGKVEGVEKL